MTTQPFTDGEYSTLKPHYIMSDYGFNPEPDIDWSTGPRQDIRSLYRRDLEHGDFLKHLEFRYLSLFKTIDSPVTDEINEH